MSVIDLGKPKKFKFAWDGSTYEIGYPKLKDLENLPTDGDLGPKESIEFAKAFLVNLGMPSDVLETMDYDVVFKIQETITSHSSQKK